MIENLIGQWVGDLRGTDIGNVFAVITDEDGRKRAEVTVNVGGQITKLAGYAVEENGVVSAELASEQADRPPGSPPSAKIIFDSVAAQGLTARWTTSTGHAGVLSLVRWETTPKSNKPSAVEASAPIVPPKPIEIVAREGRLANLTLYRAELEIIVAKMLSLAGGS